MKNTPTDCPCGSQLVYSACCGAFHEGTRFPETAEALMRSRFSAYALDRFDYIIDTTWLPQQSGLRKEKALLAADNPSWIRLTIIHCKKGLKQDQKGTVEFKAWFTEASSQDEQPLHEVSDFIQAQGRWYYIHPTLSHAADNTTGMPGRNDPCPCGSERKYKKCCLNK